MPRKPKPARLYYRKDEGQWVIRDGTTQKRTGFGDGQRDEAEKALAEYISQKRLPDRSGPARPGELMVGEVLARYAEDKGAEMKSPQTLAYSIQALAPFWGDLTCDAVKGSSCRRYERQRAKPISVEIVSQTGKRHTRTRSAGAGTVRRELGVLQASLKYAHDEGLLIHPISVTLPAAPSFRNRWLTRDEVAELLRHAAPHVRRYILLSIYTGRRAGALLDLTWERVDLKGNSIRFRNDGDVETKKRRGRVKIPRQLRGHLCRWFQMRAALSSEAQKRQTHVIMFRGATVGNIKTGIMRAAERADLSGVTPHVLKHTAITWPIMRGLGVEEAAEYFDTSPQTIRAHYWHHSPYHQDEAVSKIEDRG